MRLFLAVILLIPGLCSRAATNIAASVNYVDVYAAMTNCQAGDTLLIPAGVGIWTNAQMTINNGITIRGAGNLITNGIRFAWENPANVTTIVAKRTSNIGLIILNTSATQPPYRVTGIKFASTNEPSGVSAFTVVVKGHSRTVRIDHCEFVNLYSASVNLVNSQARGVVDHIYQFSNYPHAVRFYSDYWNSDRWGDSSWSGARTWGTTNAFYIEDSVIESPSIVNGASDMFGGARCVLRFNRWINNNIASHGTGDGANRSRGPVQWEIYGNHTQDFQSGKNMMQLRGGTGYCFLNTASGSGVNGIILENYRLTGLAPGPFGPADGVSLWDIPDLSDTYGTPGDGIFFAANATAGTTDNVIVVSGAGWTTNQWFGYIARSPLPNIGGINLASSIKSNTVDTLYVNNRSSGSPYPWRQGDDLEIRRILLGLDSIGAGICDLLTDKSSTPIPVNLHQAYAPAYFFENDVNVNAAALDGTIYENIHYFKETNSFNGSSGVGVGTLAQMNAITPSMTNVGWWATDAGGNWNTTTAAANDGAFYKWDGATWNLNYTPFTYPHPLNVPDEGGPPLPPAPAAPSNLSVITVSSSQINLTWDDNSTNETSFIIQRSSPTNSTFVDVTSVAAGVESYPDTALDASTTYHYRVRASGEGGQSSHSNEDFATTDAIVVPNPNPNVNGFRASFRRRQL